MTIKEIFMKKNILVLITAAFGFSACEKKVEDVGKFDVTVDYKSSNPKAITGDITVNPKDSIYLDFTISSPSKDMSYIEIQKNGVRIDTFRMNGFADKRNFSLVKGYVTDSIIGDYSYRVLARDERAIFMGDGEKQIKVTVASDFNFWSYRIMQVPDTTDKTNKAYFSTIDGKALSYTEGGANSANIDFGYYYDVTGTNAHSFYALNAPQTQLSFYDISAWTKNATIFKKMPTSVNFVTGLRSAGTINTLIRNNMTSGTANKVTAVSTSSGSNVIGFRTAAGKYGAILVRYTNASSASKSTQIEIDVKVQK